MRRILRLLTYLIYFVLFWPFILYKTYGERKVFFDKGTIIIANHYSNLDPFLIRTLFIKKRVTFIAIESVKKNIFIRMFAWVLDCVYVNPEKINKSAIERCISILNKGEILCIFPEGIINTRKYGFFEFKKSYLLLAKKTKCDVLPIYVYPENRIFKKSKLYVGKKITDSVYEQYKDIDERNMFFQSLIMTYSLELENELDNKNAKDNSNN